MGRWEPDAAGRLRAAAMDLFLAQGYEQTTVAQIADRAGVTARTFFRYFADKPEVLFAGSENLQRVMVDALADAPDGPPMRMIAAALEAAAEALPAEPSYPARRNAVITANPSLMERELRKMAALAEVLAAGLRERAIGDPDAVLAAEAGLVVFRVGFSTWVAGTGSPDLASTFHSLLGVLAELTPSTPTAL
jgi:AcrR family transcriptional regulator